MNSQFTCLVFMIIANFWAGQSEAQCSCSGCFDEYDVRVGYPKTFPTYCSSGLYTVITFDIATTDGSVFTVTTTAGGYTFPDLSTTDNVQCVSVSTGAISTTSAGDSLNVVVTCENWYEVCSLQQSLQFACGGGEEPSSSCDKFRQDCVDKCSTGDYGGIRNKKCSQTNGVITDSSCECNPGSTDTPATDAPAGSMWAGTWYADDDCDRDWCCCVTKVTITDLQSQLEVNAQLEGRFDCEESLDFSMDYPEGNEFQGTIDGEEIDVSVNGNFMTLDNYNSPECSGTASKLKSSSSAMPIGAIIGIVVGVMILCGIFICTIVYYRKSKKFAADDKRYALMSDTGDLQPNDARNFFSSRTQKIIFAIAMFQVITSIIFVAGLGMLFGSWDDLIEMLGVDDVAAIPSGVAALYALPWIAVLTSFLLVFMSWKMNLYCLYCGVPFLNILYIIVFAVYLAFVSVAESLVLELDGCSSTSSFVTDPTELEILDICTNFFTGYQMMFISSILIEVTLLMQTFLSCFRGCSSDSKVSNTTTVVVTQQPQQYQTEPVQLGDI